MAEITLLTQTGAVEPLTDFYEVQTREGVSGESSLSFYVCRTPDNAPVFDLIANKERVKVGSDTFVIDVIERAPLGDTVELFVQCRHRMFDDLRRQFKHERISGNLLLSQCVQHALADSGYSYNIVDTFPDSVRFDSFGRANRLVLLQTLLNEYGAEFTVTSKTITLRRKIGAETDAQLRHGHNLRTISEHIDASNLSTYIEGYGGDYDEDADTYAITTQYESPNSDLYLDENGAKKLYHAEFVYDTQIETQAELDAIIQSRINDVPEYNVTVEYEELRKADGYPLHGFNKGDYLWVIYEPLNMRIRARVIEVTRFPFDDDRSPIVQLGNFIKDSDYNAAKFADTVKSVNKILTGQTKLPYNVLDDAVKIATEALRSAQTELTFENGIIAVDRTNPNNLVLFNSAGIGISSDGGATFSTAMTGHGIVADVITGGQINANNVTVYGGSQTNYINLAGDTVEARGTHTRSWFGETFTEDTRLRLRRGYFIAESMQEDQRLYISNRGIATYLHGSEAESDSESGGDDSIYHGSGVIEFFSHRYDPDVRGLTISSNRGTVALKTYTRDVILDADRNVIFRTNRGLATFEGNILRSTVIGVPEPHTNLYLGVSGDRNGEVRVTNKLFYNGGDINYYPIKASEFRTPDGSIAYINGTGGGSLDSGITLRAGGIRTNDTNVYLGVHAGNDGEVRVTNSLGYNQGGTIGYRPIKASEYRNGSSIEYKTNVEPLEMSGLFVITKLDVKQFRLKEDIDNGNYSNLQVGLISELSPEVASQDLKSINLYKLASYNTKAIQESYSLISEQRDIIDSLIYRIEQLEEVAE